MQGRGEKREGRGERREGRGERREGRGERGEEREERGEGRERILGQGSPTTGATELLGELVKKTSQQSVLRPFLVKFSFIADLSAAHSDGRLQDMVRGCNHIHQGDRFILQLSVESKIIGLITGASPWARMWGIRYFAIFMVSCLATYFIVSFPGPTREERVW